MVAIPQVEFAGPAADEMWSWLEGRSKPPDEALLEGPAGTGKTRLILEFIRSYVEQNDGVRVLMMRDHRVDMTSTVLVEWEESVLGLDHPAVLNGPTRGHRDVYRGFGNDSEVILGGFNNATKLFSGQYHGIYFNECQQTQEAKWETLHRALRAKGGPFRFLLGDCNPEHEGHWLNQRCNKGTTKRLQTRLWHNPRFFRDGAWTEDGIEYATRMRKNLTGANFRRLYLGEWTTATGLVWPEFDSSRHLIHATVTRDNHGVWWVEHDGERHELRWFVLSIDEGPVSPGCLQAWGVTPDGVMYRVEEHYFAGLDHSEWIARAMPLAKKFNAQAMVSDHDASFIKAMNRALMDAGMNPICRNADKTLGKPGKEGKRARIEIVRTRWKQNRLFLIKGGVHRDPRLQARNGTPTCLEDEIAAWVYNEHVSGEDAADAANDPDPRCADHAADSAMYAAAYVWGRGQAPVDTRPRFMPGSAGQILGHNEAIPSGMWERRT